MDIKWDALGLVSVTTVAAALVVVGVVALGLASVEAADTRVAAGRPAGAQRAVGGLCFLVAAAVVLFGIYLLLPI